MTATTYAANARGLDAAAGKAENAERRKSCNISPPFYGFVTLETDRCEAQDLI
jgi:hypothetical protein